MWFTLLLKQYRIVSWDTFFFSCNCSKCTLLEWSIITTKKLRITFDYDVLYPSTNALFNYELRAFEYAETQCCTFFDLGVQQMLNILIAKYSKHLLKDMLYQNLKTYSLTLFHFICSFTLNFNESYSFWSYTFSVSFAYLSYVCTNQSMTQRLQSRKSHSEKLTFI